MYGSKKANYSIRRGAPVGPGGNPITQSQYPMHTALRLLDTIGICVKLGISNDLGVDPSQTISMVNDLGIYHVRDAPGFFVWPGGTGGHDAQISNQNAVCATCRTDRVFLDSPRGSWTAMQAAVDAGLQILPSFYPIWSYLPTSVGGTGGIAYGNFEGHPWWKLQVASRRAGRTMGTDWSNNIVGWEGPNEWDGGPGSDGARDGNGAFLGAVAAFKVEGEFARYARKHPSFWQKPIWNTARVSLSPSQGGLWKRTEDQIDGTAFHPYMNNVSPNHNYFNLQIGEYREYIPAPKPFIATECGSQSNDTVSPTGTAGFTRLMVPRDAQALYALRFALYPYWTTTSQASGVTSARIERSYQFQLCAYSANAENGNMGSEYSFAFYRGDQAQTVANRRLPAATAIRNLTAIIGPRALPSGTTTALNYTASGFTNRQFVTNKTWAPGTTSLAPYDQDRLHHFAVKKSDGNWLIFLFRMNWFYAWDVDVNQVPPAFNGQYQTPPTNNMTVQVPGATGITVCNPRLSSTFGASMATNSGTMPITVSNIGTATAQATFAYNHSEVIVLQASGLA